MPLPQIKAYAAKAKTSEAHVEQLWDEAKRIAREKFKGTESPKYWAYVNGIVKRRLGLSESFKQFIQSIVEDVREKGDLELNKWYVYNVLADEVIGDGFDDQQAANMEVNKVKRELRQQDYNKPIRVEARQGKLIPKINAGAMSAAKAA